MNIIEESMIINRLISPLKSPNPSPTHLNPKQLEVQVSKPNSRKSSKTNLLELQTLKDQLDSDNVVNPMSSQVDLSQDLKENDLDIEVKQVLTEIDDHQSLQSDSKPQLIITKDSHQLQIKQHKHILLRHHAREQSPPPQPIPMMDNLREIYDFYCKQPVTTNKYNTFEKLQHLSQTMILQKFMFFCKDFQLIDLEITNELITSLGGTVSNSPKKKKPQFKFNHKTNFILTKFYIVEMYKKNANQQMELVFNTFLTVLNKLAQLTFPQQDNLLFEYMGLKNPKIYRKKMTVVGKPFNSREQNEVLTQEKLCERKIILPSKPRYESVKKEREQLDVALPKINRTARLQMSKVKQRGLKWEDLNDMVGEFDAKQFILEQDVSDKEDEYYLREYQLKRRVVEIDKTPSIVSYILSNVKTNNSKNYMLTSGGNTRPSINKSFEERKKSINQGNQALTPKIYQMINKRKSVIN